ncbi:hypothetical protein CCUS01_14391 [Colletotrichum cuscutae]|uniref:Uncharacterized protein n=1 Tax=Colletotrichum cuscutae TaxID=1209917 RepID=A0AAI9Y922_9PEZI|nr:hypothetical protein CCUS01_14391 [Colletotrichum cuscutae]
MQVCLDRRSYLTACYSCYPEIEPDIAVIDSHRYEYTNHSLQAG